MSDIDFEGLWKHKKVTNNGLRLGNKCEEHF